MELGKFIATLCVLLGFLIWSNAENCRCGWKNPSRIVGGVETGVNEYPMMAGLLYKPKSNNLFCGGTIITNRHVLTGAYCLDNLDPEEVAVVVGKHDTGKETKSNATKIYDAEALTLHPEYDDQSNANDIAIIKVKEEIKFSLKVGPACLPFMYKSKDFVNEPVTALGWGKTNSKGQKPKSLQKVDLKVIAQAVCARSYEHVTSNMICTSGKHKGTCEVDNGGPVLWTDNKNNRLTLVGTISNGQACANNNPDINTRVTSYLDFIEDTISGSDYCKA